MVALWSIAGCTLVALGSLDDSTGVALGSFVGCLMVASVGFCAAGPVGETDAPRVYAASSRCCHQWLVGLFCLASKLGGVSLGLSV
ncbi:hypothetical protein V6N12_000086 [Hibiscus sabdariffa]|uniref:Uncharacterized protein n=1 Tax=Hibiscus sabdariffa TaxID=183260 RepID=A0ABR2BFH3_9ROSI